MAHNNGMVPRSKKPRAAPGLQDAAAKYQAAVDSLSVFRLEGNAAIDPAYETVPISNFVPHRPARPRQMHAADNKPNSEAIEERPKQCGGLVGKRHGQHDTNGESTKNKSAQKSG